MDTVISIGLCVIIFVLVVIVPEQTYLREKRERGDED